MPTQIFPHTILPELVGVTDESLAAILPEAGASKGLMPPAAVSKLSGVQSGATANQSDAHLLNRSNHTGQQAASTITGLAGVATSGAYEDLSNKPTLGTAASQPSSAFATSTQGGKADSALQSASTPLVKTGTDVSISAATTSTAGSMSAADKTKLDALPAYQVRSFNNTPGRSLVTTAAAANGFQIDSSRDADVTYSITITSASSLSGGSAGYVVLEIAATNSSTALDWKEISRTGNGQNNALIIGLSLSQVGGGPVSGKVPAGWYARLRTVNTVGTPTYTYNSGQEVKL